MEWVGHLLDRIGEVGSVFVCVCTKVEVRDDVCTTLKRILNMYSVVVDWFQLLVRFSDEVVILIS